MMPADVGLVPISHLRLDLPEPVGGWVAELRRRGLEVELDDVGRPSVARAVARDLFTEQRHSEERRARMQREAEQRAAEAAQASRAAAGIPASVVPPGVTPAEFMMLSDPDRPRRRESPLEHALRNTDGAVYHPLEEAEAS